MYSTGDCGVMLETCVLYEILSSDIKQTVLMKSKIT